MVEKDTLVLGFDVMAFFSRALQIPGSYRYGYPDSPKHIYSFFARHARPWTPESFKEIGVTPSHIRIENGYVQMRLCIRSFVAEYLPDEIVHFGGYGGGREISGFRCKRESGTLSLCGTTLSFRERRYSLTVNARVSNRTFQPIYPLGSSIIIEVRDPPPTWVCSADAVQRRMGSETDFKLENSRYYTGIVEFQRQMMRLVDSWYVYCPSRLGFGHARRR